MILPFFPWSTLDLIVSFIEERGLLERHLAHIPGHQIIRYDERGTGRSGGSLDLSLDAQLADLSAILDALPPGALPLMAPVHSGPAAIAYAAASPERISLLIPWASYADPRDFFGTIRSHALDHMRDLDWDLFVRNFWLELVGWQDLAIAERWGAAREADLDAQVLARAFHQLAQNDVSELLPTLPMPVIVIQPQEAKAPTIVTAQRLAAKIPGAQLLPLPGASIVPLSADPGPVHATIAAVLQQTPRPRAPLPLTLRQTDVLALVAAGLSNQEIADRLIVSRATVKKDLTDCFERLGVRNRTQAITRARELGLLP